MTDEIKAEAMERGISRLCHFTPSRNLVGILETGRILATAHLEKDERAVFTATDLQRLDNYLGHISCSIEYPNSWYFDIARAKELLFREWMVLLIKPDYLWREGTLFCVRNASARGGALVSPGTEAFSSLFAQSVLGQGGKVRTRTALRPASCPTDDQAEVLILDQIDVADIIGAAVRTPEQAQLERARLSLLGFPSNAIDFVVAPMFWDKWELSRNIALGLLIREEAWNGLPSAGGNSGR